MTTPDKQAIIVEFPSQTNLPWVILHLPVRPNDALRLIVDNIDGVDRASITKEFNYSMSVFVAKAFDEKEVINNVCEAIVRFLNE